MAVKNGIYTGEVSLRGTGIYRAGVTDISVLDIGEHSLLRVKVNEFMLNYVDLAAQRGGTAVIGIHREHIVAVGHGGVTKHPLELYDESKAGGIFFWFFFFLAACTLVLAPVSIPLGLWFRFSYVPKERKRIEKLILEVEAATNKLKESTH